MKTNKILCRLYQIIINITLRSGFIKKVSFNITSMLFFPYYFLLHSYTCWNECFGFEEEVQG